MDQVMRLAGAVQVVDLVLDPFNYRDVIGTFLDQDRLNGAVVEHLARVLPLAIAQLDAVGDAYGALALEELRCQLVRPAVLA